MKNETNFKRIGVNCSVSDLTRNVRKS